MFCAQQNVDDVNVIFYIKIEWIRFKINHENGFLVFYITNFIGIFGVKFLQKRTIATNLWDLFFCKVKNLLCTCILLY